MKNRRKLLAILLVVISVLGCLCSTWMPEEEFTLADGTKVDIDDMAMSAFSVALGGSIAGIMMLCNCRKKFLAIPFGFVSFGIFSSIGNGSYVSVTFAAFMAAIWLLLFVHCFQDVFSNRTLAVILAFVVMVFAGATMGDIEDAIGEDINGLNIPFMLAGLVSVVAIAYLATQEEDKHLNGLGLTGVAMGALGGVLALVAAFACSVQDKALPRSEDDGWEGFVLTLGALLLMLAIFFAPAIVAGSKKDTKVTQEAQSEIPESQMTKQ